VPFQLETPASPMLTYYAAICLELHHLNSNTNLIKHWHNDYSYQLVMP